MVSVADLDEADAVAEHQRLLIASQTLAIKWLQRSGKTFRWLDEEKDEAGKAYFRAMSMNLFNCGSELLTAIGKPLPPPSEQQIQQAFADVLGSHQTPSTALPV